MSAAVKRTPKTDLRWVKTEERLLAAFEEALLEQPLDQLTVTALAQAAGVNKATFYLHYSDIGAIATAYAAHLADLLCDEFGRELGPCRPDMAEKDLLLFVDRFAEVMCDPSRERHLQLLARNHLIEPAGARLVARIREQIAQIEQGGGPSPTRMNFALWGLVGTLHHYPEVDREEVAQILRDVLGECDGAAG